LTPSVMIVLAPLQKSSFSPFNQKAPFLESRQKKDTPREELLISKKGHSFQLWGFIIAFC